MMARLKQRYPHAELVLLGPQKLEQIYGGDPRIRIQPVVYGRNDNLFSRLSSWLHLLDTVNNEIAGLSLQEICIFDPDSRLTQLGLLPLLTSRSESQSYYFFQSRSFSRPGLKKLGQLSSKWLNEVCGDTVTSFPFISLSPISQKIGRDISSFLKSQGNRPIFCLSFGIGGNPSKRVSELFEIKLIHQLSGNNQIILDCGFTNEENEQIMRILSSLESCGKSVLRMDEKSYLSTISLNQSTIDVIAWNGGIGSFASLIAASDQYIGYDSSGQHISAALGIPTLTIFVNSGSSIFAERWIPYGAGKIQVVSVEPRYNSNHEWILFHLLQEIS
jgi:ADP-heptose:LPS heptosyltransferase